MCLKVINNLTIFDSNILVKADQKTKEYLDDWARQKEDEWFHRQQKEGTYDEALIQQLKQTNQILPHERILIPQYDQLMTEIKEALKDSGSILNKELNFIGGAESQLGRQEDCETILKLKTNEREVEREKRHI